MASRSKSNAEAGLAVAGIVALGIGAVFLLDDARKRRDAERRQREDRIRGFILHSLRLVTHALCVPVPTLHFSQSIANAAGGNGCIWVNPTWAEDRLTRYCSEHVCERTLALAVTSHELGHVLDTRCCVHPWDRELHADFVAGVAVALAHLPIEPARRMWSDFEWGETHPPADQRVAALLEGYRVGAAQRLAVA